jgi:hypothetical protein
VQNNPTSFNDPSGLLLQAPVNDAIGDPGLFTCLDSACYTEWLPTWGGMGDLSGGGITAGGSQVTIPSGIGNWGFPNGDVYGPTQPFSLSQLLFPQLQLGCDFGDCSASSPGGDGFMSPTQLHHIFPQQFRSFFQALNIDIDQYLIRLPTDFHQWLHSNASGNYNRLWQQWINANRETADVEQVLQQGARAARALGAAGLDALGVLEMALDPCQVNTAQQFSFCGHASY